MSIEEILTEIGPNLAADNTTPKWLTMFLITYKAEISSHECGSTLNKCDSTPLCKKFYPMPGYLHCMFRSKRKILIRNSDYFDVNGYKAEVREIANLAQWSQIECILASFEKRIELEKETPPALPNIWNIDPLAFEYTEEIDKKLKERANTICAYIEGFNEKPASPVAMVQIAPLAAPVRRNKGRPTITGKSAQREQVSGGAANATFTAVTNISLNSNVRYSTVNTKRQ